MSSPRAGYKRHADCGQHEQRHGFINRKTCLSSSLLFFYQNLSAQNQNSYGEEILFYYHRDIPQPLLNMSRQFLAKQKIIFKLYQFKDKSNHLAPSDEIIMIKSTIFVCIKFLLSNWNYIV